MKKYILLCFFVFQAVIYGQECPNTNAVLKQKNSQNTAEAALNNINPVQVVAFNGLLNRLFYSNHPQQKINISQNIDLDYRFFSNAKFVLLYIQKKLPHLKLSNNRLNDFNAFKTAV